MCSYTEWALEKEPEIKFEDVNGNNVNFDTESWGSVPEYQVVGVKLRHYEHARNSIVFVVRVP